MNKIQKYQFPEADIKERYDDMSDIYGEVLITNNIIKFYSFLMTRLFLSCPWSTLAVYGTDFSTGFSLRLIPFHSIVFYQITTE